MSQIEDGDPNCALGQIKNSKYAFRMHDNAKYAFSKNG